MQPGGPPNERFQDAMELSWSQHGATEVTSSFVAVGGLAGLKMTGVEPDPTGTGPGTPLTEIVVSGRSATYIVTTRDLAPPDADTVAGSLRVDVKH